MPGRVYLPHPILAGFLNSSCAILERSEKITVRAALSTVMVLLVDQFQHEAGSLDRGPVLPPPGDHPQQQPPLWLAAGRGRVHQKAGTECATKGALGDLSGECYVLDNIGAKCINRGSIK